MDRSELEKKLWSEGFHRVMGLDEVGRGCLAGPVVAAGVIFKPGSKIEGIRDSKKMTEVQRISLSQSIKKDALYWVVKEGSLQEILNLNILWASLATMQKCVDSKGADPDYLLIDGNRFIPSLIPFSCIIKGDDKSISIGAASILAKVYRDKLMKNLSVKYPEFGWENNVGYPTPQHKNALKNYGITKHHRLGFSLGTEKIYNEDN